MFWEVEVNVWERIGVGYKFLKIEKRVKLYWSEVYFFLLYIREVFLYLKFEIYLRFVFNWVGFGNFWGDDCCDIEEELKLKNKKFLGM